MAKNFRSDIGATAAAAVRNIKPEEIKPTYLFLAEFLRPKSRDEALRAALVFRGFLRETPHSALYLDIAQKALEYFLALGMIRAYPGGDRYAITILGQEVRNGLKMMVDLGMVPDGE